MVITNGSCTAITHKGVFSRMKFCDTYDDDGEKNKCNENCEEPGVNCPIFEACNYGDEYGRGSLFIVATIKIGGSIFSRLREEEENIILKDYFRWLNGKKKKTTYSFTYHRGGHDWALCRIS